MTGGLLQLVAKGNEDIYLTYDPQITFFKMIYKRHTNFSIESIPQNFNSNADFGKKITCTIGKNADLISQIFIVVVLPKINHFQESKLLSSLNSCAWTEFIGWSLIKYVEIEIGGYTINKHYGDWLRIWSELTRTKNIGKSLDVMLGNVSELTSFSSSKDNYTLYIPLYFWFCTNPGLALPIIALEYSDVKINIEFSGINDLLLLSPSHYIDIDDEIVQFESGDILFQIINNKKIYIKFVYFDNTERYKRLYYNKISPESIVSYSNDLLKNNYKLYSLDSKYFVYVKKLTTELLHINKNKNFAWVNTLSISNAYLLVDYIYLDIEERLKFITSNHEYLIDVLIFDNDKIITNNSTKIKLSYSHPCKELIFRCQMNYLVSNNLLQRFNYLLDYFKQTEIITAVNIIMNGNERVSQRSIDYFHFIQPFQHNSNTPLKGTYYYSFSLFPEHHQPSGSCNLSKIDDFQLNITVNKEINYLNQAKIRIYGNCINILRIINGYAGLAFSN